jgi:hypothetical protein
VEILGLQERKQLIAAKDPSAAKPQNGTGRADRKKQTEKWGSSSSLSLPFFCLYVFLSPRSSEFPRSLRTTSTISEQRSQRKGVVTDGVITRQVN